MTTRSKHIYIRMFELGFGLCSLNQITHAMEKQHFVWIVNDREDIFSFVGRNTTMARLKEEGLWPE